MNRAKNLVLFSCICLNSSLRLDVQKSQELSAPLVHVYFINLESRKDRCECMSSQLDKVSIPAFRQAAATPDTYQTNCPSIDINKAKPVVPKNHHLTPTEASLFCSNQMLYQRAYDDPNRPAFVAVLEDDAKLSPDFSDTLTAFLESDCANAEWDFLAVDTFNRPRTGTPIAQCSVGGMQYDVTPYGGFGTHLTIVRTRSLPKFLNQTGFGYAMDDFGSFPKDVKTGFWSPGIAAQMSAGPLKHSKAPIDGCLRSVKKGNIGMFTKQVNELRC